MPEVPANDVDLIADLYTWLPKWQRLLRLQDWNITVNVKRRYQMSEHDVLGLCRRHGDSKDADIDILSTKDIEAHQEGDDADYELTLVHELLHIHFAYMDNDAPHARQQEELIVSTLSRAFVKLNRDGLTS
jgi:hypothetical protein